MDHIHVDAACHSCHAAPQLRTCDGCGATAVITDCGHMAQPRPIAAGRTNGREMDRVFCSDCAERGETHEEHRERLVAAAGEAGREWSEGRDEKARDYGWSADVAADAA